MGGGATLSLKNYCATRIPTAVTVVKYWCSTVSWGFAFKLVLLHKEEVTSEGVCTHLVHLVYTLEDESTKKKDNNNSNNRKPIQNIYGMP